MNNLIGSKAFRKSILAVILFGIIAWLITKSIYPEGEGLFPLVVNIILGTALVIYTYHTNQERN